MPIPTRSASLREPRKPTSNLARPTTAATPASASTKAATRLTNDKPRSSTNTSPAEGVSLKDDAVSNRGRTLLPQRSNIARDDGTGSAQVRFQPSETRLPQRGETSPRRQPQANTEERQRAPSTAIPSGAVPTRRQSLIRPGALKTTSTKGNVPAPAKGTTSTLVPPSPRKPSTLRSPTQSSAAQRPPSPKKTEMLPPPRPMRSASMRQPREPASGPTATVRGHARHRSQLVPTSTKPTQLDPSPAAQKPRAQFSTYQQHYSPKKPTKPPTPTPGATSGPDSLLIPTSWTDIAALQTELLQLSLFHSSSLQQHAEWKAASESRLRKKYDAVADQYRSILVDEKSRQRLLNAQSLARWLQNCRNHQGPHGFPEQVQIFSQVLQEIADLGMNGTSGRYAKAVAVFEDWFQQADHIRHQRETTRTFDGTVFIDPLDKTWKEEVHALHAKLELCDRHLQSLDILGFGEVEQLPQSALTRVARGLAESIQLMLQEIRAMRSLEAEMVRSERECVCRIATELTGSRREMSAPRVGVWRT